MWEKMNEPWRACFEQAWDAYCNGSIPIGAVIVSNEGEIISRGRNMIYEEIHDNTRISNSRLAHAEINAIYNCKEDMRNTVIYSTMEPCVMCFGAIAMNRIAEICYAARDGIAGGIDLENEFIRRKAIKINEYNPILEIVQLVIITDFIYRNYPTDDAERMLNVWEESCPVGIQLGRKWYEQNRILLLKENNDCVVEVLHQLWQELNKLDLVNDIIHKI